MWSTLKTLSDKQLPQNLGATILAITGLVVFLVLGRGLNPIIGMFFDGGHDETQAARIDAFTDNLVHGNIPPRLAPQFSFGLGYPVFNFYAPTAYWITSLLNLITHDSIPAMKWSYLLALLVAGLGTFWLLKLDFRSSAALLGSSSYMSALYLAVDIFVRTNLAETWFIALVPVTLWALRVNATSPQHRVWLGTGVVLSLSLTTHNLLSPLWAIFLAGYLFTLPGKWRNATSLLVAILLSAYFYLPLLVESRLIQVSDVAKQTNFMDHFVCPGQLWRSAWGFGGSNPGCDSDGMSFMVGKPQLALALAGLVILMWVLITRGNKGKKLLPGISTVILAVLALFLTTTWSEPLWQRFGAVAGFLQFPWRLIGLSLSGIGWLAAFGWDRLRLPYKELATAAVIAVTLVANGKYFTRMQIPELQFREKYASAKQVLTETAYKMPEYLPKTVNYQTWIGYDRSRGGQQLPIADYGAGTFIQQKYVLAAGDMVVPVHYFPYWQITVNGANVIPDTFDRLGRPIIKLTQPGQVTVRYRETLIEKTGDLMTMVMLGICLIYLFVPRKTRS